MPYPALLKPGQHRTQQFASVSTYSCVCDALGHWALPSSFSEKNSLFTVPQNTQRQNPNPDPHLPVARLPYETGMVTLQENDRACKLCPLSIFDLSVISSQLPLFVLSFINPSSVTQSWLDPRGQRHMSPCTQYPQLEMDGWVLNPDLLTQLRGLIWQSRRRQCWVDFLWPLQKEAEGTDWYNFKKYVECPLRLPANLVILRAGKESCLQATETARMPTP